MYLFSSRGAPKFVGGGGLGGGRQKSRYFLGGGGGAGKWVGGRLPPARAVSASGYGPETRNFNILRFVLRLT
jgi:hypothetical protein